MRAYLSTGSHRTYIVKPDEDGICNILPGITPTRSIEWKQRLALREAKRILAATESETEGLLISVAPCTKRVELIQRPPDWITCGLDQILAVSLARFLKEN